MEIKKTENEATFLTKIGIILLFVLPIFTTLFYAITLPVSCDEAFTFLNFTHKGYTASMTNYPDPNNHVLHSLLTNVTNHIPGLSTLLKLRISSLLISFFTSLVLYKFISTHFNKKMAIMVVAISSMLFLNIYYGYMSRGYALVNFFFVGSLFCAFNIIKNSNGTKNWILFSILSIFGFFTIPSYLYPFLTLNCFILLFQPKNIWKQMAINSCVLLLVFLLYLPIITHNGIGAITNNIFVKPIGFILTIKSLPKFYLITLEEITGIHWVFMVAVIAVACYLIIKEKNRKPLYFAIVFILAPIVLLSIHRVIPFARVFNYYSFIIIILLCIPFEKKLKRLSLPLLLAILLVIQIGFILNFDRKIYAYEDKDYAINITSDKLIPKIIGNKKYLFNNVLLATNLEFQLIDKGYKQYTIKEVHYPEMNADSIHDFDYIMIDKETDRTKTKKAIYKNQYYSIYK
jgi:hypothetical protein